MTEEPIKKKRKSYKIPKPRPIRYAICLPADVDYKEVNAVLAKIAKELGFTSIKAPLVGSVGHMLHAIATGRAIVVNLVPKDDTPK